MSGEITESFVRRHYYALLVEIIGVGILGRLFHFHLTIGSDDQRYILAARWLMGEEGITVSHSFIATANIKWNRKHELVG